METSSTLICLGLIVGGAIAMAVGATWLRRFRREGYRFRLHEFDDPGSGYAAVWFVIVGAIAAGIGFFAVVASFLGRLGWL